MKILIAYFSQTGNTEKIAKVLFEEASQENDVEMKKIEEVDPAMLNGYDFIFVGSPIHAANIASDVKEFLGKLPASSGTNLAGFITHAGPAYPKQQLDTMSQPFRDTCQEKEMEYKGCFNCQGYLADFMHEAVQKMQKVDDETWAENVKQMTGHPNAEDEFKAKFFVKSLLG